VDGALEPAFDRAEDAGIAKAGVDSDIGRFG
jgi:hypothetical protein